MSAPTVYELNIPRVTPAQHAAVTRLLASMPDRDDLTAALGLDKPAPAYRDHTGSHGERHTQVRIGGRRLG